MNRPFKDTLRELADPAAEHEFTLARRASHFAKVTRNLLTKTRLYTIKTRAVSHAVQLAPGRVWIGDLAKLGHGIIGVGFGKLGQLHVPMRDLPNEARRIVNSKLAAGRTRSKMGGPARRASARPTAFASSASGSTP